MWEYTDKVREHFLAPHNVGELKDANATGEVGSLACGDALKLFLKIEDGRILDASFLTFGCASAIASSSVLTDLIKGKTIEEALAISNKDIADALGGLPPEKMHCSVMGQEALEAAIRNYRGQSSLPEAKGHIICKCFGVSRETIQRAIKENSLTSIEQVTNFTKAGGACGGCISEIESLLQSEMGQRPLIPIQPARKPLSNIQRMQKVMTTLNELVRPRLQQDGGDVELVDIEGSVVTVALRGMCSSCPSSNLTLEGVVQQILREQVDSAIVVKGVTA